MLYNFVLEQCYPHKVTLISFCLSQLDNNTMGLTSKKYGSRLDDRERSYVVLFGLLGHLFHGDGTKKYCITITPE